LPAAENLHIRRHRERLFDYLVGAGEQRGWHLKTERLGGLEVDHELILVGCWTGISAATLPLRMRST
jgi:hypothetical protein